MENKIRYKMNREYFERGCKCIINKSIEKIASSVNDKKASEYYEKNCTCSRNYI